MEKDKDLKERCKLGVDDIVDLIVFIAYTTYFSFSRQIYKQTFGIAMGSPVSSILVNFSMEGLQRKAIAAAPLHCKPKLCGKDMWMISWKFNQEGTGGRL